MWLSWFRIEITKSCNFVGMNIKKVKKLWTKESEHFTETLLYFSSYTNIENSPIYLILIWFSGKTWENSGKNLNLNVIKWSLVWSRGKISRRERDKSIAVLAEPWFASIERRNWVPPLPSSSPSSPCQPWFSPPPTPLTPATTTTSRPPPRSCRSRSRSRSAPQLLGGSFDPAPPLVAGGGAAPLCQSCAEPQEE